MSKTGMEVAIITAVDPILFEARSRQKQIVALIREMPLEKRLVVRNVLDTNDPLGLQLHNSIDQQHWIAMR